MPDSVFALLRVVVERPDFAALFWDATARRWSIELYNGRVGEDGRKKVTAFDAPRLTPALEAARAEPLPGVAQTQLRMAGGAR